MVVCKGIQIDKCDTENLYSFKKQEFRFILVNKVKQRRKRRKKKKKKQIGNGGL